MDALAAGCHPEPVTPSDDLSPPRRPIFFPVVIATVFLTIIGLAGGFVLGERHRDEKAAAAGRRSAQQTTLPGATPEVALPSESCPEETREFAVTQGFAPDLRQVLRVETDNGTVVWICEDPQRQLFYQGKTGGPDTPLVQNKNALFLPDVTERDGEYVAVARNGNQFLVDRDRLEIRYINGNVETHRVVAVG
jgi:hypothetical protein